MEGKNPNNNAPEELLSSLKWGRESWFSSVKNNPRFWLKTKTITLKDNNETVPACLKVQWICQEIFSF